MRKKSLKLILLVIIAVSIVLPQSVLAQGMDSIIGSGSSSDYLNTISNLIKDNYKDGVTDSQLIEGAKKGVPDSVGESVYTEDQKVEQAVKGMFGSMDPYTVFFNTEEAKTFFNEVEGTFQGVGIMLNQIGTDVIIAKVFPASPAEKVGLVPGDKIVSVDGKSVSGLTLDVVTSYIRGEAGTQVVLGIIKNGKTDVTAALLNREEIKVNPVTYDIKDGIGYIRLDVFNANTNENITQALEEMDKKNINKIVLDLRNNPGGEVSQAVAVAQKIVPQGLITKLEYKSDEYTDRSYYSFLKDPKYKVAVLVNKMSASASEILAGAIQDTKAGTLIGTKTFGKSRVQVMIPVLTAEAYKKYKDKYKDDIVNAYDLINKYQENPLMSEIGGWAKITVGEYKTPQGRVIDQKGLDPDIFVDDYKVPEGGINIYNITKLPKSSKPGLNDEGIDVYDAEKILKLAGYDIDTPDTKLDVKTFYAIGKFQKDSGLFPYGVLDFTTQQALNDKLNKLSLDLDKQYAKAVEILKN